MIVRVFALSALTVFSSLGLTAPSAAQKAVQAPPTEEPKMPDMSQLEFGKLLLTQRCANCHGTAAGEDRFAAPLHHLFGRMPGSIEGYTFSNNMKNITTPWTARTLDNWLAQTTFDTPDIRMRHVGITKHDQRSAVIAYLKTLAGNSASPDAQ